MAGHNKWSQIKHKKAKEDSKRSKIFTKLIKEITVAAREGGGDPAGNPRLRLLLEKAREVNMPIDNANRAIKRGTGELPGASYEELIYEGYGPGGIAVIIDTLSDNKNRTVAELRSTFTKLGGTLGDTGSVAWMFEKMGVIRIAKKGTSEDSLMEALLDYDIRDIKQDDEFFTIICDVKSFDAVKNTLKKSGQSTESAAIEWVAKTPMNLDDDASNKAVDFLEALDDLDDVQNVYTNLA